MSLLTRATRRLARAAGALLGRRGKRVYFFIAFAPEAYGQDLGRTYNDYMERLGEDDVAVFIDHDAMLQGDHAFALLRRLANEDEDRPRLHAARTNRIYCAYQRLTQFQDEHDLAVHDAVARRLHATGGHRVADVTALRPISGLVMMVSRRSWNKVPFARGFLEVDNAMHEGVRDNGGRVFLPESLYAYHFYRADDDRSHAVILDDTSAEPAEAHRIRNFVYPHDDALCLGDYLDMLADGDWATFIDGRSMFCQKRWYPALASALAAETGDRPIAFNSNRIDRSAPATNDHLGHRRHAADLAATHGTSITAFEGDAASITGFALSRAMLERFASGRKSRLKAADIPAIARRQGIAFGFAPGIYIQSASGGLADTLAADRRAEIKTSLKRSRRVAIISAQPHDHASESAVRHIAIGMTLAGDHVTLFTPHDRKATLRRPNFLMRIYAKEDEFRQAFADHHAALPFDCILAQGGRRAGSLALEAAKDAGIPVTLRLRGPEIQLDETIGHGDRRDPKRTRTIAANIAAAARIVVASEHLRADVLALAPQAAISVIANGVDTEGFAPSASTFIRDRVPAIAPSTQILLLVGRNAPHKRLHLALDGLAMLRKEGHDVCVVHAGGSGDGADLDAHARALGLADRFHSLGALPVTAMPALYASADIFLRVSLLQPSCTATLEAMAMELPCVEFDCQANRDKIIDGQTGYLIANGDMEALVQRLAALLSNGEQRAAMGRKARRHAIENFGWETAITAYRNVLRQDG